MYSFRVLPFGAESQVQVQTPPDGSQVAICSFSQVTPPPGPAGFSGHWQPAACALHAIKENAKTNTLKAAYLIPAQRLDFTYFVSDCVVLDSWQEGTNDGRGVLGIPLNLCTIKRSLLGFLGAAWRKYD